MSVSRKGLYTWAAWWLLNVPSEDSSSYLLTSARSASQRTTLPWNSRWNCDLCTGPQPPMAHGHPGCNVNHFLSLQTHPPCLLLCCQSNPKALLCGLSWPVACAPRDRTMWAVPPWVWSESECQSSGDARKDLKRAVLGGLSLFLSDCVSWDMSAFENLCRDASEVKGQPWGTSSWTLYDSVLKANPPCLWCFWPSWDATEAQRGQAPGLGHTARKWGTWREAQTPRVRKRGESFSGSQTSQKHSFLLKGIKARDNNMLI